MKLPLKITIRDLFWLVLVVGLALGWVIDRDNLRVDFNTHLNVLRRAQHREEELTRAIQGEDYVVRWDEKRRSFTLTKATGRGGQGTNLAK
jgi:hypothetical protein